MIMRADRLKHNSMDGDPLEVLGDIDEKPLAIISINLTK